VGSGLVRLASTAAASGVAAVWRPRRHRWCQPFATVGRGSRRSTARSMGGSNVGTEHGRSRDSLCGWWPPGACVSALVRFNGIVEQLREGKSRERLLRRALGLRGEAWHAEDRDRRADVAWALAWPAMWLETTTVGWYLVEALGAVEVARGKRALASARTLRYTSIYVHPMRGCTDIDGYFDFGRRSTFSLSLVAAGILDSEALRAWQEGDPLTDDGLRGLLGGRHILIPGDEVTPELAADALQRWYKNRFEYKRRHWTHPTGAQPTIVLDLKWEDADSWNFLGLSGPRAIR
jgi:hypothetical protein